jgi:hypothetical protein
MCDTKITCSALLLLLPQFICQHGNSSCGPLTSKFIPLMCHEGTSKSKAVLVHAMKAYGGLGV